MYRLSKLRFGFPIGLLLMLFLDGSISQIFSTHLFRPSAIMVSHLVVLWLIAAVLFEDQYDIPIARWAAAAGAIFDLYYTGIFGVYVFIFPLAVYLTRLMVAYISPNFLSGLLIYFIDITMVEALGYLASRMVHLTSMAGSTFLVTTLGPTLALNLALFVVLYFPIRWVYNWLK
ncbi:rod shape-determining protein MreD [Levilactobacillus zymae]|uniref:Rod shape-determining protein MreD n=1 Tax=Levilactobacillus zymae TaxID=267363 RepID=A0A1Y6JXH7_9LACO|nr:rod shape-determining protein MreD [Levilactobacillus zymae]KRL10652.1 cell shape-determining protein [Levilactobacillus zymae DSM 19395]QFR60329.1 rod shape-determining protein MreD [Levilactobacillus zymae]GEO71221.1 rod shape-determining protein MreD [Levilactobacillus zymae]SMS14646.1 Rod shape-determining protein MreD [Levilactobacillus zymae]